MCCELKIGDPKNTFGYATGATNRLSGGGTFTLGKAKDDGTLDPKKDFTSPIQNADSGDPESLPAQVLKTDWTTVEVKLPEDPCAATLCNEIAYSE